MDTFITKISKTKGKYARKKAVGSRHDAALSVQKAYFRCCGRKIPDEKEFEVAKECALMGNRPATVVWLFETCIFILKQVVALALIFNEARLFYVELIAKSPLTFILIYFGMDIIGKVVKYLADKLTEKNELIEKMSFEDYKKWIKWEARG